MPSTSMPLNLPQEKKLTPEEKINIYKNLFKGRKDVFASRWEKKDKSASGYTPVCSNEWKPGLCIKLKRGKCRDCDNKAYSPFGDYHIEQHLRGRQTYGIYPLLDDNTSFFLAADFDGKNWQKTIIAYAEKCKAYELPVFIEKSRSGRFGARPEWRTNCRSLLKNHAQVDLVPGQNGAKLRLY